MFSHFQQRHHNNNGTHIYTYTPNSFVNLAPRKVFDTSYHEVPAMEPSISVRLDFEKEERIILRYI